MASSEYRIEVLPDAETDLSRLPPKIQRQLANRIDGLRRDPAPPPPASRELKRMPTRRRLRAGDYRVVYQIDERRRVVTIIRIGLRARIYKLLGID